MRALLEDLGVGPETDRGAAPVADRAQILEARLRRAARESLAVKLAAARHFHFEMLRKGVHDGDADAMQAAAGRIDVRVEFAAGMQRRHDDFERRLPRIFRVRIDRNAAPVVGDAERAIRFKRRPR